MTDRNLEERGFELPRHLDTLCSGSRALCIFGCSIIGSLRLGLDAPDFLQEVFEYVKAGDRVHVSAYSDRMGMNDEARSEVAELLIVRKHEGFEDRYRRWTPPVVEFHTLSYFNLKAAPAAVVLEAMDVG